MVAVSLKKYHWPRRRPNRARGRRRRPVRRDHTTDGDPVSWATWFVDAGTGGGERHLVLDRADAVRKRMGVLAWREVVAMGSVVTKKFEEKDAMVGGVPAMVLKKGYQWKFEE